jgi:hypothetical protein
MDRDATWKGLDRATVEILSDLKALEGFVVGNQDLGLLDALCSTASTSLRPPDGIGDGHEDEGS